MILPNLYHSIQLQDTGKVIISMDALFGLPRKKAAGGSLRPPLHGHLFFEDQDIVDEYVNGASKMKSSSTKVYT